MLIHRAGHSSWMDQFVLRGDGPAGPLAPFAQAVFATEMLIGIASDRSGLTRPAYDEVGKLRYQAVLLGDFLRSLEADFRSQVRNADAAVRRGVLTDADASQRARTLMASLTGSVQALANLTEVCQALIEVADGLLVIERPRTRLELVAAVEGLRAAASTALVSVQGNINRITDAVVYDRLEAVTRTVEQTLARAEQVSAAIRNGTRPRDLPAQRAQRDQRGQGTETYRVTFG